MAMPTARSAHPRNRRPPPSAYGRSRVRSRGPQLSIPAFMAGPGASRALGVALHQPSESGQPTPSYADVVHQPPKRVVRGVVLRGLIEMRWPNRKCSAPNARWRRAAAKTASAVSRTRVARSSRRTTPPPPRGPARAHSPPRSGRRAPRRSSRPGALIKAGPRNQGSDHGRKSRREDIACPHVTGKAHGRIPSVEPRSIQAESPSSPALDVVSRAPPPPRWSARPRATLIASRRCSSIGSATSVRFARRRDAVLPGEPRGSGPPHAKRRNPRAPGDGQGGRASAPRIIRGRHEVRMNFTSARGSGPSASSSAPGSQRVACDAPRRSSSMAREQPAAWHRERDPRPRTVGGHDPDVRSLDRQDRVDIRQIPETQQPCVPWAGPRGSRGPPPRRGTRANTSGASSSTPPRIVLGEGRVVPWDANSVIPYSETSVVRARRMRGHDGRLHAGSDRVAHETPGLHDHGTGRQRSRPCSTTACSARAVASTAIGPLESPTRGNRRHRDRGGPVEGRARPPRWSTAHCSIQPSELFGSAPPGASTWTGMRPSRPKKRSSPGPMDARCPYVAPDDRAYRRSSRW